MSDINEQRIALLHPKIRAEVRNLVAQANAQLTKHSSVRITQTLRTFEEQDALYAQGRTKPGKKVTNAKGGQSNHNFAIAFDFCLIIDGKEVSWDLKRDYDGDRIADWMEVVKVFRNSGYEWGGLWKFTDNPHFEKTFGHDWRSLLKKWNAGDTFTDTNGYKYVNI